MNIELILWIIAYVILSEGLFIYSLKNDFSDSWISTKIFAFIMGAVIIILQFIIVFPQPQTGLSFITPNYLNLLSL